MFYILENGEPKQVEDVFEWARWLETENQPFARTSVGRFVVSTVFLGLDHSFGFSRRPILYETLVFDSHRKVKKGKRYFTLEEASLGHTRMVEWASVLEEQNEEPDRQFSRFQIRRRAKRAVCRCSKKPPRFSAWRGSPDD